MQQNHSSSSKAALARSCPPTPPPHPVPLQLLSYPVLAVRATALSPHRAPFEVESSASPTGAATIEASSSEAARSASMLSPFEPEPQLCSSTRRDPYPGMPAYWPLDRGEAAQTVRACSSLTKLQRAQRQKDCLRTKRNENSTTIVIQMKHK